MQEVILTHVTRKEALLILDSLGRRMSEVKHGGGSDWQDYYRVYEPIVEKIKAALDAVPCTGSGSGWCDCPPDTEDDGDTTP